MGNTGRNALTKTRHQLTSLGCAVVERRTLNQQTGCVDHEIVLSHPLPIVEVAFSIEQVLERESRR